MNAEAGSVQMHYGNFHQHAVKSGDQAHSKWISEWWWDSRLHSIVTPMSLHTCHMLIFQQCLIKLQQPSTMQCHMDSFIIRDSAIAQGLSVELWFYLYGYCHCCMCIVCCWVYALSLEVVIPQNTVHSGSQTNGSLGSSLPPHRYDRIWKIWYFISFITFPN